MATDLDKVMEIAEAYTAAWNSGSPAAVAEFYAEDGRIVINRGEPWEGRTGIADMAAGFFADVPDLTLVCDNVRCAGDHVAYLWTCTGTHSGIRSPLPSRNDSLRTNNSPGSQGNAPLLCTGLVGVDDSPSFWPPAPQRSEGQLAHPDRIRPFLQCSSRLARHDPGWAYPAPKGSHQRRMVAGPRRVLRCPIGLPSAVAGNASRHSECAHDERTRGSDDPGKPRVHETAAPVPDRRGYPAA